MSPDPLSPFSDEPLEEVPLDAAPLVLALAQVRFPLALGLTTAEGLRPVAEALADTYPVVQRDQELLLQFSKEGVAKQEGEGIWRLQSPDGSWQVSLSSSFVALETTDSYESRTDFVSRLGRILSVLQEQPRSSRPARADRIGVRYVNRLVGDDLSELSRFVRPEVRGMLPVGAGVPVTLERSMCHYVYQWASTGLQIRCGRLPADTTFDPAVPTSPMEGWVLDIDSYSTVASEFVAPEIEALASRYAEHAYRVFRWALTDDFLEHAGGQL